MHLHTGHLVQDTTLHAQDDVYLKQHRQQRYTETEKKCTVCKAEAVCDTAKMSFQSSVVQPRFSQKGVRIVGLCNKDLHAL